jgi:iron complex transport system ATP-binding protein
MMAVKGYRMENLSVGYGSRVVVSGITAQVLPGEILVLLGENGAGKSTLLKTAAGLLEPIGGDLWLNEVRLSEMNAAQRAVKMSVLLSERSDAGQMTCREIVEMGRYPYTGRFGILGEKDHEIVDRAMAATDTSDLSGTDYGKISDGQRQRVRLARSIAQEPKVLLLDEPTVYLDIRYQAQFMRLLRTLCRERKMAAIVSMHEVGMALASADTLLCLKDGAVYASGTPRELKQSGCLPGLYGVDTETLDPEYGPELADYLRLSFGTGRQAEEV